MAKILLIKTDGYSIELSEFDNMDEAKSAMVNDYESLLPDEDHFIEDYKQMSYCSETNAILYLNGEDVYVWKIYIPHH